MDRANWQKKIIESCENVGTYKASYGAMIETLAAVLEQRDAVMEQYEAEGSEAIVEHTNKAGATNKVKNPLLILIMDLNTQALSYWRDLGLTPAGLKKINADALNAKATSDGFEALLAKLAK